MLPAKRQAIILEHLRKEGFASLAELARLSGASVSTIRRDVDFLAAEGHLDRSHGGVSLRENERVSIEPRPDVSREIARPVKALIGRRAGALVEAGQTVFLDSGSTTMAVARGIADRDLPLTVITNDVSIAGVLAMAPKLAVSVTGGVVRPRSATVLGAECLRSIARLQVDWAFLGAHAVAPDGASETSVEHAEIKMAAISAARNAVLVADSGKFPHRALCRFATIDAFRAVITDAGLAGDLASELSRPHLLLEIVECPSPSSG